MSPATQTLALIATGTLTAAALVAAPTSSTATAAEPVHTRFGLQTQGYSTLVRGGDVPERSGPTGYAYVTCTRQAAKDNRNHTAEAGVPAGNPLIEVGATRTHSRTRQAGRTVSAVTSNHVSEVTVGETAASALVLEGVRTYTRAFHNRTGFHRRQVVTVTGASIGGRPVASIPSGENLSGATLDVPGVATVRFGLKRGRTTDAFAVGQTTGLRIDLDDSRSTAIVGRAYARIDGGATAGVMNGPVWGSQLTGAGGVVNAGRTALRPLSCVGTDGEWRFHRVSDVRIPGFAGLGDVVSKVRGDQAGRSAYAQGASMIQRAGFGDRRLVIAGVQAEGYVKLRRDGSYVRQARGTTVGRIVFEGERLRVPGRGETLRIPGVARITVGLVDRSPRGIRVTAVRAALLQGREVEGVLALGNVNLRVRRG